MKKKFKKIRYFIEYVSVLAIFYPVRMLPHSMLFILSDFAGYIFFMLPSVGRIICSNLKVAFPEKKDCEIRRIGRKSASNLILTLLEFFWFAGKKGKLEELVDYPENVSNMTNKYKNQGKGLIWVTPHLGNWEIAGLKFRQFSGIPFAVVVRPLNNPFIDKIISFCRGSEGNRIIPSKGAVKGMIKAIREGFFIATLIDQNTRARDGGVFVEFFGLPVPASAAPALFARKYKVPVAVGGCFRKGRRYETFAFELPKESDKYESDEEIIQDILKITEGLARQYPEQYLWFYKRWLYIPETATDDQRRRYPFYSVKTTPRFYSDLAPK